MGFEIIPEGEYATPEIAAVDVGIPRSHKDAATCIYIEDYLGKGESILIIDDLLEQGELARRVLQRLGYDVQRAAGVGRAKLSNTTMSRTMPTISTLFGGISMGISVGIC
jgi:hypothetical protein